MFGSDRGCQSRERLEGRPCPQLGVELTEADSLPPPNCTSKEVTGALATLSVPSAEVNLAHLRFRTPGYH